MKTILLLIFVFSCGPKDKFQEIPYSPKKSTNTLSVLQSWSKYSPKIDIMVAFLWPLQVKVSDRPKLASIIETSRELKSQKELYLLKKRQIQIEYDRYQCACVIDLECTGEEEDLNETKCYEIEELTYANDRELVPIFGLVEKIKSNVIEIGGEWLKTHMDFRELPSSSMDFHSLQIQLSAFGGEAVPLSYEISGARINQEDYFKRLSFSFKREIYLESSEKASYGNWEVDAAIVDSEASLLVQGKLFWNYQGVKREGLIYWEHPRVIW